MENKTEIQKGCTHEMRQWVKQRDGYQCQFHEFVYNDDTNLYKWRQCQRKVDPKLPKGKERWQLEVHHIYPQHMQSTHPTRYGGENPFNLITLCAGLKGEIGHHELMAPFMIIAKMTYAYDRWITFAHEAQEKGMSVYDPSWDGMLKTIARTKTDLFKRNNGTPFPFRGVNE